MALSVNAQSSVAVDQEGKSLVERPDATHHGHGPFPRVREAYRRVNLEVCEELIKFMLCKEGLRNGESPFQNDLRLVKARQYFNEHNPDPQFSCTDDDQS